MRENAYDRQAFFDQYCQMDRSVKGLSGAGEWHALKKLMPDLAGKRVLDLGCGFGWHCRWAMEQGAQSAVGIDLSERMLQEAKRRNPAPGIQYQRCAIEDYAYPPQAFDVVISSLALHYVADFDALCQKVAETLVLGGHFVFSVEHPIFTAQGPQDWLYDSAGTPLCWPVDRYFEEGKREAVFLGEQVVKYHKTLTTYVTTLLRCGFTLTGLVEPKPDPSMMDLPGMKDELRRPMMLLIAAERRTS